MLVLKFINKLFNLSVMKTRIPKLELGDYNNIVVVIENWIKHDWCVF